MAAEHDAPNAADGVSMSAPQPPYAQPEVTLPSFPLLNANSMCYLNSLMYSLWAAATSAGHADILPQVLRRACGEDYHSPRQLGFSVSRLVQA